ncbi:MAG TPA: hypothetical protein VGL92_12990 [Acidimicrobiia bacterium]
MLEGFPDRLAADAVTSVDQLGEVGRRLAAADRAVVIAGSSISGLVLAARLGRAAASGTGGRLAVVLVTGSPPVPKRLVAGCSLRWSTVRRMARALGVTDADLVERMGGHGACFGRLAVARAEPGSDPPRLVQRKTDAPAKPFVGLSTRHGHILSALRASLDPSLDVVVVAGDVNRQQPLSANALPLLIDGEEAILPLPAGRSVVLNATSRADLLRLAGRLPEPERFVVAVQVPLVTTTDPPWCGDDVGLAPMTFGPPAPHLAFFTPFRDPDTPQATWYGINTMSLSARRLENAGAPAVTKAVWDRLVELEEAMGLAEVDPAETRAEAVVPVVRDRGTVTERLLHNDTPVVDVHRSFTSGAPAINVDGMLAATVGGDAFATAFLASAEPAPAAARAALVAADKALQPVRWRNWATEWSFFRGPEAARAANARMPGPLWRAFVLDWNHLRSRGGLPTG